MPRLNLPKCTLLFKTKNKNVLFVMVEMLSQLMWLHFYGTYLLAGSRHKLGTPFLKMKKF